MPTINYHSDEEFNGMKVLRYRNLGYKVMAVAVHKIYEDLWCVYIKDVPGESHSREIRSVVDHGYKIEVKLAVAMFPELAKAAMKEKWSYTW